MTEREDHDHSYSLNENSKNEFIFDPNLIESILKTTELDKKYLIRPLSISDYDYGYIDLLSQLTECGNITYEQFKQRFYQMKQCLNTYFILVIQDIHLNKQIIGTATLVCEQKFIRQLSIRGRIEDVVVDNKYRGQQLGKTLIHLLTTFAKEKSNCYKVSLECKDNLIHFYKQFGYHHEDKQNYLCQRFQKTSIKNK